MKHILIVLFLAASCGAYAQQALPVVKATSAKARIRVGDRPARGWNIDPREKRDIFTTSKLNGKEPVWFVTDTDSLMVRVGPGEQKDFIVLLDGKDSCYTGIRCPEPKNFSTVYPEIHDTIPLFLNEHNAIYVMAVINGTDTLMLNFDTGSSDITLTNETLKGKLGSSLQPYNTLYDLQIGRQHYKSVVYPAILAAHGTEGRFGWDLFDGYIVELDYDQQQMIVHSRMPDKVPADKDFIPLPIWYVDNIFLVESTIAHKKTRQKSFFLFDSGYERTVMLDKTRLRAGNFPVAQMPVIKTVIMKGAQGNEIPVVTSELNRLSLGKYTLKQVPVQVQDTNKPLQGLDIHILGNEVLKRFNTVMDFQQNIVYLKPSKHFGDDYIERKAQPGVGVIQ